MSKVSKQFLIYTFIIMAICWGTCMICSLNGLSLNKDYYLYVPYLLGGWSPAIASYIVLKKNDRVKDFKEWLKNVFDFKHGVASYSLVIVLYVLFVLPQCIVSGYEKSAPIYVLIVLIPMMIFAGGLEEAGWRYVLQSELEKKYPYIVATIIVSVIWWLWHFPLFYINGVGQEGYSYIAYGIEVFGMAFALACIRKCTNSVWLCVLMHCIVNASGAVYMINDDIIGRAVMAGIMIVITLYIVYLNDKKNFFR
ncbi:MAG: CPBP family intramembrane metalloprotease [Lachnospiraceae bacterium]|nr:CPBP family intramembrane metalloprotease [Lachnospiraceae bacterium]